MNKEIRINRKQYVDDYLLAVILCWTIIIPICIIAYIEINVRATKYIITDKEIHYKWKFLSINEKKISKKDITDVSLSQDLMQRIFKIGNIHINTAGSSFMEMVLIGIENPDDVMKTLK